MNIKAVSPMIATIILIAITVLTGTLIFKFGNDSLANLSPPADCSQVNFNAGIFQESDESLTFEVENVGDIKLESFIIQVKDEADNLNNYNLDLSVNPAESKKQTLDFTISENSEIKIIPEIKNTQDKIAQCSEEFGKLISLVKIENKI